MFSFCLLPFVLRSLRYFSQFTACKHATKGLKSLATVCCDKIWDFRIFHVHYLCLACKDVQVNASEQFTVWGTRTSELHWKTVLKMTRLSVWNKVSNSLTEKLTSWFLSCFFVRDSSCKYGCKINCSDFISHWGENSLICWDRITLLRLD